VSGRATVDANQYKVRGKILIDARAPGEAVIEFTSTVLFGHAREDFLFSSVGDTLRIIDRERGAYYEGEEAESYLAQSLDTDLDVRLLLRLALGGRPSCEELMDVGLRTEATGGMVCTGEHMGRRFRVVFGSDRRLREIEWPVPSRMHGMDSLRVSYEWTPGEGGGDRLRGLTLTLERREWRCKVRAAG
jgi:hypothetical protein